MMGDDMNFILQDQDGKQNKFFFRFAFCSCQSTFHSMIALNLQVRQIFSFDGSMHYNDKIVSNNSLCVCTLHRFDDYIDEMTFFVFCYDYDPLPGIGSRRWSPVLFFSIHQQFLAIFYHSSGTETEFNTQSEGWVP